MSTDMIPAQLFSAFTAESQALKCRAASHDRREWYNVERHAIMVEAGGTGKREDENT